MGRYEADSTKKFKAQSETVFVGDYKLFKRSAIDASQADKWAKTNLPAALRGATLGLAKELGYTNFPLQVLTTHGRVTLTHTATLHSSHSRD